MYSSLHVCVCMYVHVCVRAWVCVPVHMHTSGIWTRLFVTPCGPNGSFFGICIFPSPLGETSVFNSIGNSSGSLMWLHGLHQNHLEELQTHRLPGATSRGKSSLPRRSWHLCFETFFFMGFCCAMSLLESDCWVKGFSFFLFPFIIGFQSRHHTC